MDQILNSLNFPSPRILTGVVQRWEPDPSEHIGMTLLPMKDSQVDTIEWDVKEAAQGLTAAHALDSEPMEAKYRVLKNKKEDTAFWKEYLPVTESEMTRARQLGTIDRLWGEGLIMDKMAVLNARLDARQEQLRWDCLQGTVTINENGVVRTVDYEIANDNKPTASTLWSDTANANPIANLMAWSELFRGKAGQPTVYINRIVAKYLAQNAVVRDLVKQSGYVKDIGVHNVGELISNLVGSIDRIVVYDAGYINTSGTFVPFIPNTKAIMVAKVPRNQPLGHFVTTPSVHNGSFQNPRPGKFGFYDESRLKTKNPRLDVCTGIYGLPILYFPECVVSATVAS